jgi:hypothetical protein
VSRRHGEGRREGILNDDLDVRAKVARSILEDELGADYLSKPLAGSRESAAALRMPLSSFTDAVARGDIPARRIGHRIYTSPAEVAAWLMGEGR